MQRSNLLLLNDNPKRLDIFDKAPLFLWQKAEYKFLSQRKTLVEYFCKIKQPLVNSTIELTPIAVELLYGELSIIICSGIGVGFIIKLLTQLNITVLGESLMIKPKLLQSDKTSVEILLSLPDLQVMVRDNTTQFLVVRNLSLVRLE